MIQLVGTYLVRFALNLLYLPLWVFPIQKNKVSIFSRQSSKPSIDIELLVKELTQQSPTVKVCVITHRDNGGIKGSLTMMGTYIRSLYPMATSKVCVLESYWPPLSVCKRRPNTKVVQMWHSIGKVKQSGLVAVGRPGGRSSRISKAMRMHEGYDYIIAGAKAWNSAYVDSFGCDEAVLRNVGLPRIDYLVNNRDEISHKIYRLYPELKGKQIVLYAPTFRRGADAVADDLLSEFDSLDSEEFAVVVKAHPNQAIRLDSYDVLACESCSALELLSVADFLITDYSAIALEAAAIDVKTLYYVPDYRDYATNTGLNIDLPAEMPHCVFQDAALVVKALQEPYPIDELERYKQKYVFANIGTSATAIANIIFDEAGLVR